MQISMHLRFYLLFSYSFKAGKLWGKKKKQNHFAMELISNNILSIYALQETLGVNLYCPKVII